MIEEYIEKIDINNFYNDKDLRIYFKEISKNKILSRVEEIEYFNKLKKGDESYREKIILANLKLVVSVAKRFSHYNVPIKDLINEGNIGLFKAIEKFDLSYCCKFSTYAIWWIRQAIYRSIFNKYSDIILPEHIRAKVRRVIIKYDQNNITVKQLINDFKFSKKECNNIILALSTLKKKINLDEEIDVDNNILYIDTIKDNTVYEDLLVDKIDNDKLTEKINSYIESFPTREQEILKMRFGFQGYKQLTLEETGNELNLSRERIRQIQDKVIIKLKQEFINDSDIKNIIVERGILGG